MASQLGPETDNTSVLNLPKPRVESALPVVEILPPTSGPHPGFAKLELPSIQDRELQRIKEFLKSLPPEEQVKIISTANEEFQRQVHLRLGQLDIFSATLSDTLTRIETPQSTMHTLARYGAKLREFVGMDKGSWAHHEDQVKAEIEEFAEKELPIVRARLLRGEDFSEIIKDYPLLQKAAEKYHLESKRPATETELREQQVRLLVYYRNAQSFDAAEQLSHELLRDKLNIELAKISAEDRAELLAKAQRKIESGIKGQEESLKNPSLEQLQQGIKPMTDAEIIDLRERFVGVEYQRLLDKEAAKGIDRSSLSETEAKVWDIYNEVFDPKSEWFNLTDAHHDMVIREVLINAPFIIASGGTASIARGVFTTGAKALAGRIVASGTISAGAELGVKELLTQGGKWLGETALRRVGTSAVGLAVEGTTFEAAHLGLQGEWLGNMPDWGQKIFWSCVTLGMIHGGGALGESAFRSVAQEGSKAVVTETALGRALGQISNEPVRKAAEYFLIKGHTEAAAMMLAGAAQEGCVTGSLSGFIDDLPEELLHTYVTLGALKAGHGVVKAGSVAIEQGVSRLVEPNPGFPNSETRLAGLPQDSNLALQQVAVPVRERARKGLWETDPFIVEIQPPGDKPTYYDMPSSVPLWRLDGKNVRISSQSLGGTTLQTIQDARSFSPPMQEVINTVGRLSYPEPNATRNNAIIRECGAWVFELGDGKTITKYFTSNMINDIEHDDMADAFNTAVAELPPGIDPVRIQFFHSHPQYQPARNGENAIKKHDTELIPWLSRGDITTLQNIKTWLTNQNIDIPVVLHAVLIDDINPNMVFSSTIK